MYKRLLVRGHCDAYSGYGQLFLNMVRGLRDYGYDLVVRPTAIDEKYAPYPEDVKRLLWDREPMIQRELFIHLPRALYPNRKVVLWYTMWESTRLQSQWVEYIDSANAVIVPSTYNANVFSANGIHTPIHKIPLFIDDVYEYREYPNRKKFIFGAGGRTTYGGCRKGLGRLMELFTKAFPDEKDVELQIKTLPDTQLQEPEDKRIHIIRDYYTEPQMLDWYKNLNAFVSISTSEGWGFMQHQAMKVGRPLISTNYAGVSEYFDDTCGLALDYEFEQATDIYKDMGIWAVPTEESIIRCMRILYGNRELAKVMGQNASERVSQFTKERTITALSKLIQKYDVAR